MNAKVQKEFVLMIGTNEDGITEENLIAKALELEQLGNSKLGIRVHISIKK